MGHGRPIKFQGRRLGEMLSSNLATIEKRAGPNSKHAIKNKFLATLIVFVGIALVFAR